MGAIENRAGIEPGDREGQLPSRQRGCWLGGPGGSATLPPKNIASLAPALERKQDSSKDTDPSVAALLACKLQRAKGTFGQRAHGL